MNKVYIVMCEPSYAKAFAYKAFSSEQDALNLVDKKNDASGDNYYLDYFYVDTLEINEGPSD